MSYVLDYDILHEMAHFMVPNHGVALIPFSIGRCQRLLDLTVGTSERAVIPHDLTDALDRIRKVAPALADAPALRRLSTSARR